mmetsp:Transcript_24654/g.28399  ORF Transcript_24654/g.28399 Transcript_24654/m.28399 type:complete len:333 (-) Transcript_24654:25-1023(-)|eukprot:CAMPEP_0194354824 /NCGR_PEP_ID=MMETSP0174-20130528/2846_1 /TAXON_ID=216777 /ORGANISM="Proboscia alata, Strain PI-D3" /LENGTH=332 /DNA_ID=CAMNT_0039123859 /DNA_START=87 /DNA_END=1085 /DNA_ORIENTATION=+
MGGDDLGSDDEFLNPTIDDEADDDENDEIIDSTNAKTATTGTKRKAPQPDGSNPIDTDIEPNNTKLTTNKKQKKKEKRTDLSKHNTTSSQGQYKFLLEASREIATAGAQIQASFLWTAYSHHLASTCPATTELEEYLGNRFQPHHFAQNTNTSSVSNAVKTSISSMKNLKKWQTKSSTSTSKSSPMVIIVCSSTKRCASLLKELSSLKVRVMKLFAKNIKLEEQLTLLQKSGSDAIAVGTPNRLLKLARASKEGKDGGGLVVDTELVLLDSFEDHKRFTVCTMNDTAPDLMMFLKEFVQPRLEENDGDGNGDGKSPALRQQQRQQSLKLAFF